MPEDSTLHVDDRYARTDDYRQQLQEIREAGVCPFCPEHFLWHPHPILRRQDGWFITEIRAPYENAALHFLIICDRHISHVSEMRDSDWIAVGKLIQWACTECDIPGGGIAIRFGPTSYTGSSVQHLHAHLIKTSLGADGSAEIVNFPFG